MYGLLKRIYPLAVVSVLLIVIGLFILSGAANAADMVNVQYAIENSVLWVAIVVGGIFVLYILAVMFGKGDDD